MKKKLQKIILTALIFSASIISANAQNWQLVGNPNFNGTVGFSTYLYFADLEFNAAGDAFAGYWDNGQLLHFQKLSGGTWTALPSPGTCPVNYLDIEVKGNNYYMAYSGVRGSNMYVFVKKYNGTTWTQLGDSLLLGNSGSGGWFDFVLDNNEVPTLLGVVATPLLSDKQAVQFNGTAWTTLYTYVGSAPTVFQDNGAAFDSQNKLYACTQSYISITNVTYYTIVNKLDAGVNTIVGDTLWGLTQKNTIKFDATGNPYVCYTHSSLSKMMAYKLNGSVWGAVADTSGLQSTLLHADLTGDGKWVYDTQTSNLEKSVFIYDNGSRLNMDSLNIQGVALGGISDLVVPSGSSDVYALLLEISSAVVEDISLVKHSITGSTGINDITSNETISFYPNPSNGVFTLNKNINANVNVKIYNSIGNIVYQNIITNNYQTIDLSTQAKGIYFVKTNDGINQYSKKIIIQ